MEPPYFIAVLTYIGYMLLFLMGHFRDFFRRRVRKEREGYAPIRQDYEDFYSRRLYKRIHDCWNRPICSDPGAKIEVMHRERTKNSWELKFNGKIQKCINLGSYNYLGFGSYDPYCTPRVISQIQEVGWSSCSPRTEAGTTPVLQSLERKLAQFLAKQAAIIFGMGFATNSFNIPALTKKGTLIISDAQNHASIVAGVRGSGAKVKVFEHNSTRHLEQVLKKSIADGQPRTHRPWKKILIIIEGIYSMEGDAPPLKEIVAIKNKYKAYLFLDEAHSIGALGSSGKGICDQAGVDTKDIDVMMGTFTKSFGSCGGYIAGSQDLIDHLRLHSPASLYATSMSPGAAQQTLSALQLIMGEDGSTRGAEKMQQLKNNSNYFRQQLKNMGISVLGSENSPVMPIMIYQPAKLAAFSRMCYDRGLATVVVGYPATALLEGRCRICISAALEQEDLDQALKILDEVTDLCNMKYNRSQAKQLLYSSKEKEGKEGSQQTAMIKVTC